MTQPAFYGAYLIAVFSAGAQYLIGLSSVLLPRLYSATDIHHTALLQVIPIVLSVPINYVLIPFIGRLGAGFGLVVWLLLVCVACYLWRFVHRHYVQVRHQWKRLGGFIIDYSSYVVLMLWQYNCLSSLKQTSRRQECSHLPLAYIVGLLLMND